MSASSSKLHETWVGQLEIFDKQLGGLLHDPVLVADIRKNVRRMLAAQDNSERTMRQLLQERIADGSIRKQTNEIICTMLDKLGVDGLPPVAKQFKETGLAPLSAVASPLPEPEKTDPFGSTTIIEDDVDHDKDTADDRVQVGSVLRDRFLLQERVSGGSMGVVYKALDRRLAEAGAEEPWVAVKVLSPQLSKNVNALRALQQEAAKGRCLTHSNIVRFIDLDRDDDLYFIVMEWLDGRTLADILDTPATKRLDIDESFRIVRELGKALDYAHRCGIVHADVKPANVMILPGGGVKLFDFGVARVRQKQFSDNTGFDPGVLRLMTPAYSSMQVLTGEDPVPADDVYSLACLAYRLIAGYRVFGPRNAAEAAEQGMTPQPPKNLTDGQWRVLKKALSFARVTRFDSMQAFIDALDMPGDGDTRSIQVDVPRQVATRKPRRTGRAIFGFLLLLALAGFAAYQYGYLDDAIADIRAALDSYALGETPSVVAVPPAEPQVEPEVSAVASSEPQPEPETVERETEPDARADLDLGPLAADVSRPEPIAEPMIDFATLPPPTAEVVLAAPGDPAETVTVTLREDGPPAVIDVVRRDTQLPLTLRLEEISFSGNRSPFIAGQYSFSDNGFLEFPQGQDRARFTLTMTSDPLREADQQSTLRIRESDSVSSELARLTVFLEDDDQRTFESQLPVNTIAFGVSQISVRESDPAVQVDIQRFNPDDQPIVAGYVLRDVTAREGEDYFAPGGNVVTFEPGQRVARLLIPLVQDTEFEGDEAFVLELSTGDSAVDTAVFRRLAIMIRDDDLARP